MKEVEGQRKWGNHKENKGKVLKWYGHVIRREEH